ncbi:hypothetical protein [Acidaminococcus intestini]|uniref:hypothetical protein n=3 Tax=Acidaminococcus intestini TaxID=187327 RepID=UPI0024305CC6|nr:hypothetical protein [Acidaminococcus intestini]
MKRQAYQHPELRDANDNIIQEGTYGKESPLVNSTNDGVLDYINNNLEALHDNINGSRIYVANKAALPATGDLSAMYIAEDTGKWYLWDGTKYIETDNARKIADEAMAARDAAKASQTAAKTSENNAASSASAAAGSATNAANSASAAATSATAAKNSQTAAAASAKEASSSQSAAADSATNAANSAREQQSDWNVTDTTSKAFIKNKPDVVLKSGLASSVSTSSLTVTGDTSVPTANVGNATSTIASTAFVSKSLDEVEQAVAALFVKKSALSTSVSTTSLTVTGTTSVPTANEGNSSKAIANTEFVAKSISALVNGAPDQLNTLNELAEALGNDSNFAATVTAELAKKLNSAEAESTYATKTEAGVPYQIKRNTAYKVGDVLTSPSLPPGCVIVVTQAGTTGSTEPDWATIKSNMGGN